MTNTTEDSMTTTESWNDPTLTWDVLRPHGAFRFYDGDDPDGFVADMKAEFGFDPTVPVEQGDGLKPTSWTADRGYSFFIPAGLVEAVYGSERWPLGS